MRKRTFLVSDELFFSIAFFLTAILKPFTVIVTHSSLLLLLAYFILLMIVMFRNNGIIERKVGDKGLIVILLVCATFVFDILFRKNGLTSSLFIDFFRCGIIPFIFLLYVKDYNKLLYMWAVIAVCVGLMYCTEPLNGYRLTGNYMQFGYGEMLPAFLGTLILIYFFQKKRFAILSIFYFIELCLFANKGAILTAIMLVIGVIILSKNRVSLNVYLCIGLISLCIVIFHKNILVLFYNIAKNMNFNSYSLNTIAMMLNGKSESILNLRFDIWNDVMELMSGHWLDGYGIGYYIYLRQTYPHNLLLDILIHGGLLCVIPFLVILFKSLFSIRKIKDNNKRKFAFCMLIIWIIPMNMSLTLWQYAPFWIYFWVVLSNDEYCQENSIKVKGLANTLAEKNEEI